MPRSPVSRSDAGTPAKGSTAAACSSNRRWAATLDATCWAAWLAVEATLRDATGTLATICASKVKQANHATARRAMARAVAGRRRPASPTSRRTASAITTTRPAASTTAPSTAPTRPAELSINATPLPSWDQSNSGSKGRPSTERKPICSTASSVSTPSAAPPTVAAIRRRRPVRTSRIASPSSPSAGMRRNAPGESCPTSRGRTSAANTSDPASTVSTVAAIRRRRGRAVTSGSGERGDGMRRTVRACSRTGRTGFSDGVRTPPTRPRQGGGSPATRLNGAARSPVRRVRPAVGTPPPNRVAACASLVEVPPP